LSRVLDEALLMKLPYWGSSPSVRLISRQTVLFGNLFQVDFGFWPIVMNEEPPMENLGGIWQQLKTVLSLKNLEEHLINGGFLN
jgi:hypothetical protein